MTKAINTEIKDCIFRYNIGAKATVGGAVYISNALALDSSEKSTKYTLITNCEFTENYGNNGAALHIHQAPHVQITGGSTSFTNNSFMGYGTSVADNSIYVRKSTAPTIEWTTEPNNYSTDVGSCTGAVYISSSSDVTITGSSGTDMFSGNR